MVDYLIQIVDASGNVDVETNKGRFFQFTTTVPDPDALTISLFGHQLLSTSNAYEGPVTVVISAPGDPALSYSLDGGTPVDYHGPFVVAGDGPHVIQTESSDGESTNRAFFIGSANQLAGRRIVIQSPQAGATYAVDSVVYLEVACNDVGLGTADCVGEVPLGTRVPTSHIGMETLSVSVRDGGQNRFTQAVSYAVGDPCSLPPTITASPGVVVEGTAGDDIIRGTSGDDVIHGNGGDDIICAGAGNDTIDGGAGNDYIEAGNGNDTVTDPSGHNLIRLGAGDDSATTGPGDDYISGDAGNDTIAAGRGNDTLDGGSGDDELAGGDGIDECIANSARDTATSCEAVPLR